MGGQPGNELWDPLSMCNCLVNSRRVSEEGSHAGLRVVIVDRICVEDQLRCRELATEISGLGEPDRAAVLGGPERSQAACQNTPTHAQATHAQATTDCVRSYSFTIASQRF